MKFKFQFESLLHIRRHEEKKEQQELGRLLGMKLQIKNKIDRFRGRLEKFEDAYSNDIPRNALDIRHYYELRHDVQKKIWDLKGELGCLEKSIERQRERLMQANQKTKMLEELEERERKKFIEHHQHREQLQQNEIATQLYNRT
ncbi:MAG: flagellar FliJ family protein [Balneolaceae bacterium]|jgi:flagellar export protein FliJ